MARCRSLPPRSGGAKARQAAGGAGLLSAVAALVALCRSLPPRSGGAKARQATGGAGLLAALGRSWPPRAVEMSFGGVVQAGAREDFARRR